MPPVAIEDDFTERTATIPAETMAELVFGADRNDEQEAA